MRKFLTILAMAALPWLSASATVSVSIGINVGSYPALQRIPGYPVYYVPGMRANYFFYDGLYWVYVPDGWYVSPWYDGPWDFVPVDNVPLFVLRVPVRYYGYPPVIFRQWLVDAPPRWDTVWGPDWASRHRQWQHWNRAATPPPAPLPRYQRSYTRANYPDEVRRRELAQQHYSYKPHDAQARQQWQNQVGEAPHQALSRPNPPPRPEMAPNRPAENHSADRRPAERENVPHTRHPLERTVAEPMPERPPMRSEPPHAPPPAVPHVRPEEREPARTARPEHGDRPDKPHKGDNEEGREQGRRH